jgi:hypothetical protein
MLACVRHGIVQKEYVEVPDKLLGKTPKLKKMARDDFRLCMCIETKFRRKEKECS